MLNAAERNHHITTLLNGSITSIRNIVPLSIDLHKPQLSEQNLSLEFGVLIGITGDIKGKMVLTGESTVFGFIGEKMFGMALEGEMLASFSGELGNMIAGGMSTHVMEQGLSTDITSPTILEGRTTLTGFKRALHVPASIETAGLMNIYLLMD